MLRRTDYTDTADKREFIKISQAVGIGFVVMGFIGYVVKLSTGPSCLFRPRGRTAVRRRKVIPRKEETRHAEY